MLISRPRRNVTLFVTGVLAGIASGGCSKDSEPSPRVETASSPATPVGAADSAAATLDTAAMPVPVESAGTAPKPAARPRRATTRPAAVPQQAAATAAPPSAATGDSAPPPAAAEAGTTQAGEDEWLKYDPATNTVTFELIGGPRGFAFNGYSNGGATLTLPSKANVVMNFINKDGTPHSAAVISGEGPLPNAGGEPALPRAYTNQLLQGLPQEGSDVMRFQVPESGSYRIFCGVPGHGLSGMWIWMKVDPAARTPSFGPTRA